MALDKEKRLNLRSYQPDIDEIYQLLKYIKAKYQLLINKRENVGLKH